MTTMLKMPALKARSSLGRSTIYVRIDQGLWTRQVRLGPRGVAWPAHEVEALIAARIAGLTDEEIRALVVRLHAARKIVGEGGPR